LRNAAVVLGNIGDTSDVPALAGALRDDEPLVRQHVAWALGRIGGEEARRALTKQVEWERDPEVLNEIRDALGQSETLE
jgi:epoxyqueuosine reductase